MSVKTYFAARQGGTEQQTAAFLRQAVTDLSAARRGAIELLDSCHAAQAAETPEIRAAMEQTAQTLGAIVRELGTAVQGAREAQMAYDQLARVETELQKTHGGAA